MGIKMKIYYLLINRVTGIRSKYNSYRKQNQGIKRIKAWCYLGVLNFRYYILRQHQLGEDLLYPDRGKKIVNGSESALSQLQRPEELVKKLSEYDVISFDVFDTLILRNLQMPEDVFYLVQKDLHYINLKSLRKEAEWKARQKRNEAFGDYEVTLEEIWDQLNLMTSILPQIGMDSEFRNEQQVCYANPYFLEVVTKLKERGKKLVICSDMYLGENRIAELLAAAGYPSFDQYFISCDYRKSKVNGKLYDILKDTLGKQRKYIHIGDNEYSDVKQARKQGLEAVLYRNVQDIGEKYRSSDMSPLISSVYSGIVNGYLHNGLYKKDPLYEFGYIYGGLFVTGYCQFVHEYVKNNGIQKILFLSRDGDILKKAYLKMYPEDLGKTEYAYWSRLAAVKLCAHRYKAFYLERMILHKVNQNYTLKSIFETMEIGSLFDEFKASYIGNISEETILDNSTLDGLLEYVHANWERITGVYKEMLELGKCYYARLLDGARKVVVVDVGWVGSGAITLKQLIENDWKLGCRIYGLVAGSCSGTGVDVETTAVEYADGEIACYLFSASENRDVWKIHDAAKGHNMIVELLLSSKQYSFKGFTKEVDDGLLFSDHHELIDAEKIQEGILDFVEQYQKHPLHELRISGRDAMAPILLLYQNEDYIDYLLKISEIKANIE